MEAIVSMDQASATWLLLAVFSPLICGVITLFLPKPAIRRRVALAVLGPALSVLGVLVHVTKFGIVSASEIGGTTTVIPWVEMVHLNFSFLFDGLGIFFALLVSGIGLLIVLYARAYFGKDEASLYRFYPTLGFFTTAMMGIVLSDFTLLTLLFWELTSISSFLLIGWDRDNKESVRKAMQAFFTTGLGGMMMFGGILLVGMNTGCWRWSELFAQAHHLEFTTPLIAGACLMMFGAATKSAQYPFHYWLPGAMAAPTPVSAYLHSATMVKAGVYLTARMFPVFSHMEIWPYFILIPGAITMLYGAGLALAQHDLKRMFAYTTVSQLGLLMCAYGLGAFHFEHHGHHAAAIDWDISQIANHAFYKAPLFIVAGAIGHVAGTRDLPKLFGFFKQNKPMVIVTLLAGYALAGGPGTISFPAKEMFFYAIVHAAEEYPVLGVIGVMAVLTAMFNVAIFVRLFTTLLGIGQRQVDPDEGHADAHGHGHDDHEHETGLWAHMLWIPAALIVVWQYVGGIATPLWNSVFANFETNVGYFDHGLPALWQVHFGMPVMMSIMAFGLGIGLGFSPLLRKRQIYDIHDKVYPGMYWLAVTGGGRAFRTLQTGNFRHYLTFVLIAFLIGMFAVVYADPAMLNVFGDGGLLEGESIFEFFPGLLLGIIICFTALILPMMQSRVVRVLVLGSCGFSVVGMYLIYQAPDLALTQLMFEIISVILFVLVLRLLPDADTKKDPSRVLRAVVASLAGLAVGWMTLVAAAPNEMSQLGDFFLANSYHGSAYTGGRGGGGNNVVNVILVDFRGFDTLGEITVLSIAALGVWALLPGRKSRREFELAAAKATVHVDGEG